MGDGVIERQVNRRYRCIRKGCPNCGGDLVQWDPSAEVHTLTCTKCNGTVTFEREEDLKDFPPSKWV